MLPWKHVQIVMASLHTHTYTIHTHTHVCTHTHIRTHTHTHTNTHTQTHTSYNKSTKAKILFRKTSSMLCLSALSGSTRENVLEAFMKKMIIKKQENLCPRQTIQHSITNSSGQTTCTCSTLYQHSMSQEATWQGNNYTYMYNGGWITCTCTGYSGTLPYEHPW